MGNFLSRLKDLMYYTDTEPLEIMGGAFRLFALWHMGVSPGTVTMSMTGLLSIVVVFFGSLSWRNLSNLVGTTVPLALILTSVFGLNSHCHHEAVFATITSLWCLIRTMHEVKSRGYK